IFRLRAPGMAISRMPLFLYSTMTISFAIVMSLPALTVACVFLELDRRWGAHFFHTPRGERAALGTTLLGFWPPVGLRNFFAGDRDDFNDHTGLLAAPDRRLPVRRDRHRSDGTGRFRRLGTPHVRDRDGAPFDEFLQRGEHDHLDLQRGSGLRLGGHDLGG